MDAWPYLTQPNASTTSNPAPWFIDWLGGGAKSDSGITVTRDVALTYSAVWQAVTTIAGDIAGLPLNVYERDSNGDRDIDYEHPSYWLLNEEPNDLMTSEAFRETLQGHALMHGNGYAAIYFDNRGRPEELIPLIPQRTEVDTVDGRLVYTTRDDMGQEYKFLRQEILHIKGFGPDGIMGYSVIRLARNSIGLGLVEEKHGSYSFRNNTKPNTVLKHPGRLDEEQASELRAMWMKNQGKEHLGWPAITHSGVEVETMDGTSNADAEWLASRQFQREEIASWFRLPVHKLGSDKQTSYNSLEVEERAYINMTLRLWLKKWETETKTKLISTQDRRRRRYFTEHDVSHLIQSDSKTMNEVLEVQRRNEVISPNEWRKKINLKPRTDPGGDDYRNPNTKSNASTSSPDDIDESTRTEAALHKMVSNEAKRLVNIECERVKSAVKSQGNFVGWIDKFYDNWGNTLSAGLRNSVECLSTVTGCTHSVDDLAGELVKQSKSALLDVTTYSFADNIEQNVSDCIADWPSARAESVVNILSEVTNA